jgi:hypothetical protein
MGLQIQKNKKEEVKFLSQKMKGKRKKKKKKKKKKVG